MRWLFLVLLSIWLVSPATAQTVASKADRSIAQAELGRTYLQEGSLESAILVLNKAVELDRRNWSAWTFLGLALAEKGRPEQAERAFKKAIHLADERAEPHLNYGLFLFSQDRVDEAIEQYQAAIDDLTYRRPSFVLNNLGFALYSQGEHDRAITTLSEAVRRAPNLCPARFNLGLAQAAKGDSLAAIDSFESLNELCGEQPGTQLQLGILLLEQGRTDEAEAILRRVLVLAPGTQLSEQAESLLASLEG